MVFIKKKLPSKYIEFEYKFQHYGRIKNLLNRILGIIDILPFNTIITAESDRSLFYIQ